VVDSKNHGENTERHAENLNRTIIRLVLTYLAPFILLSLYFYFQSYRLIQDSRRTHMIQIAEHQSNIFDLFLRERVVNLKNIIQEINLDSPINSERIEEYLIELKKRSDTFVDLGFFDSTGVQIAYSGPYPALENRNYNSEPWYINLRQNSDSFIITDIYLGFREHPHFTIGVYRVIKGNYVVLRATLDPDKISEQVLSIKDESEIITSIVNQAGTYQLIAPHEDDVFPKASLIPPKEPNFGYEKFKIDNRKHHYAYSWLQTAKWALIVQAKPDIRSLHSPKINFTIMLVALGAILLIFVIILFRARKIVELEEESVQTKAQLGHASKLATVGELAGGIAHEINNPLAVITEEAGLLKDLMDPELANQQITNDEIREHLDNIHDAAFRARDITRKLLGFVRKTDIKLDMFDIHGIINDVVDGFLAREMALDNIKIIRNFNPHIPQILTDKNQLEQVILNIIKNGADAIEGEGEINIDTSIDEENVSIAITDTGKGITKDQMNHIFLPFYTTKEVGKGTGLGLSVSYGIVKSMGGRILVDSVPGRGSVFTVLLPLKK